MLDRRNGIVWLLLGILVMVSGGCSTEGKGKLATGGQIAESLSLSSQDNGRTITGLTIDATGRDYGIRVEGAENITIENCQISNAAEANVLIRGSNSITLRNCTITGGSKSGVRLSSAAKSSNITIEGNTITGAKQDGIIVGVDEVKGIRHSGVVISGNKIRSVASDDSWPGHYHGMYIQTPGYLIKNNQVIDVYDGNGISVRAGGSIENNVVVRTGKNGISYYADHDSSSADTLVISENQVWEVGKNTTLSGGSPLALLELPSDVSRVSITKAKIVNNSLGPEKDSRPLVAKPSSPNYLTGGIEETGTLVLSSAPLD